MTCNETLKTIEDYHYGELDDLAAARVASHLRGCKECSAALDALEDEAALYRAYRESVERSVEVTPTMWETVRLRIANSEAESLMREPRTSRLRRSFVVMATALMPRSPAMRQVAYSAILVVVSVTATLIAVGVFRLQTTNVATNSAQNEHQPTVRPEQEPPAAASPAGDTTAIGEPPRSPKPATNTGRTPFMVVSRGAAPRSEEMTPQQYDLFRAMQKIQRAERDYVDAIKVLNAAVSKRKSTFDPRLLAAFEKNLTIVDGMIAQTRKAYGDHPGDPEIAQYMLLAYAKKVELLRELAY